MPPGRAALAAVGELQRHGAVAQQLGQAVLRLLLLGAQCVVDAPARRALQQLGVDVQPAAVAAADALQPCADQLAQRRQRTGGQLRLGAAVDAPGGRDMRLQRQTAQQQQQAQAGEQRDQRQFAPGATPQTSDRPERALGGCGGRVGRCVR